MPITRLSLTLLGVTLGLLALPPVAGADVYCVNYPCIGGHSAATVDEALAAAAAHDGDDTVRIGAGPTAARWRAWTTTTSR